MVRIAWRVRAGRGQQVTVAVAGFRLDHHRLAGHGRRADRAARRGHLTGPFTRPDTAFVLRTGALSSADVASHGRTAIQLVSAYAPRRACSNWLPSGVTRAARGRCFAHR